MERLKISYDGLEHDEKELFLEIACFMRRWEIDNAMRVLDACGFHPGIGIKVLVQKSLIKVSDGRFDLHDLIEEMAHYIVRGEHPDNPEKHSRIWKLEDIFSFCDAGAAAPLMDTEVLAMRDDWTTLMTFGNEFKEKKKIFWFSEPGYDNHQRLPNVIANMKKLRWIDWKFHPAFSFSSNFQPTRLGCLLLKQSRQKQLWKGFKSLPSLKILDLENSWWLKRIPDFSGLPCLERLNLEDCWDIKKIHPSIGYLKSLVWVNMKGCRKLKWFPPIIDMIKLETLVLSKCRRLKTFPDIQTRMDSLVNLHMDGTGIKLVPHSVGQFCTNLVYFDLEKCYKLQRIEGNFRLLKRLKYLKISGCILLEKLEVGFFGDECCLEELPQFPCLSRKLDLSWCNLGNEDIPLNISGFINLQILDLSHNYLSRLHSSLSKIPCLKFLKLSGCENLVELPDLPSSIAILIVEDCKLLQSVGDLSNCKWLWKVSLKGSDDLLGVTKLVHSMLKEKVVRSMLEINAVEDRFMSIELPFVFHSCEQITTMTLKLPGSWYNDFSGFLLSADDCNKDGCRIYIKQEMLSMDSQPDHHHWNEFFDNKREPYKESSHLVGYVPFGSLRHTSWWNLTFTHITFRIEGMRRPKVGLVPRKSKSRETPIHYSECWEEIGDKKTFQIIDNPKSLEIEIQWSPGSFY